MVLTSRNVENGEKAKNELEEKDRRRVTVLQLDILSKKSIESFKCSIESIFGGFDILIQNSGIAPELTNRSVESLAQTIETNFMGSYRVLRALFPMVRSNGRDTTVLKNVQNFELAKCGVGPLLNFWTNFTKWCYTAK